MMAVEWENEWYIDASSPAALSDKKILAEYNWTPRVLGRLDTRKYDIPRYDKYGTVSISVNPSDIDVRRTNNVYKSIEKGDIAYDPSAIVDGTNTLFYL